MLMSLASAGSRGVWSAGLGQPCCRSLSVSWQWSSVLSVQVGVDGFHPARRQAGAAVPTPPAGAPPEQRCAPQPCLLMCVVAKARPLLECY